MVDHSSMTMVLEDADLEHQSTVSSKESRAKILLEMDIMSQTKEKTTEEEPKQVPQNS